VVQPECARPAPRRVTRRLARRPVLLGLAGTVLLVPLAGLLAGCGSDEPDPLQVLAERALTDAAMIDGVRTNTSVKPNVAATLATLAEARRAHARSLAEALGESNTIDATPPSTAPPPSGQGADAAVSRVRDALDEARQEAGDLVLTLPRQHAGLVGSIAACCAAYRAVLE
jgi:hypothetical protein